MNFTGNFQRSVFKRHFQITLGKMLQPQQKTDECVQLPYLRAANVGDGCLNLGDLNEMWFTPRDVRQYTLSDGDLLVLEGGDVGRSTIMQKVEGTIGFQNSVHRVRPRNHNHNPFGQYWLNHLKSSGYFDLVCSKATLSHFTVEKFLETPFPNIGFEQQKAIADYLDRETGRIDGLIEKKTRFIALLKEKRAAVIDHAVTKGIDRSVEVKPSGLDWLGDIPAHWDTVPPTVLFKESKERAHEGDQLMSATQKYGVIPLAEFEALEQRQVTMAVANLDKRKHVEVGDFVISMRSMDGGLERARAVGSVRSSYSVLKCGPEVEGRFFGYLLKSSLYIQALRLTTSFIRDGQDMNFSHFRKVRLPRIPIAEQTKIADHIERETTRIDGLLEKTERSIALLKEKRAALITAAVTGKIDVRAAA